MRLALCQIDLVVGDVAGNTDRVLAAIASAAGAGAEVALLPELALTGYPPEDLLAKGHFVSENIEALERVAASAACAAVVGFVDRDEVSLYNAAAFCAGGEVVSVYRKRLLPNYGVFDERRWFRPGRDAGFAQVAAGLAALTICEDVWGAGPVAEVAAAGARVVLNISASPFDAGKGERREAMLRGRARDNGVWLAYCNLVGGQDELVFDGRSCVIAPDGTTVARAKAFEEDILIVEVESGEGGSAAGRAEPALDGPEEVWRALSLGLGDYCRKNGFEHVVLGLSGGIDSALTAVLAADTLGPDGVTGVLMPSRYSSEHSVTDARDLAAALGIGVLEVPIDGPFAAFEEALAPAFRGAEQDVTEENLQARVRGTLLMALSNKFGWLVLATGNKSELSVGYSTLYGDMVGGFAPLKDVFKTRVYDLARWRNAQPGGPVVPESTLTKAPSAELREGQTDQDSLPPYDELDAVLAAYVEQDASRDEIVASGHPADLVERVCRMVDAAEYKRRQGPLGVRTTQKAFGRDRRMPVTNGYRG